jgi:hypothetical protein
LRFHGTILQKKTPGFFRLFLVGEHYKRFVVSGWKVTYMAKKTQPLGMIWALCLLLVFRGTNSVL